MSVPILRPPLPPPLSHDGILFTLDLGSLNAALSEETLVAIASSLQTLLPPGDFTVDAAGALLFRTTNTPAVSLWRQAGLLEGIDRSSL